MQVDIQDADAPVYELVQLVALDNELNNITDTVNLGVRESQVQVPVLPYRSKQLTVGQTGMPMPGYMVTEITIEPQTIELVGSLEELDSLDSLQLGMVELDLVNETIEQKFDIRQALSDTGLTLRSGSPIEANARLVVERVISRDLFFAIERLRITGSEREFKFETSGELRLSLRGRESVINALSISQISGQVDLTGLGAGTHIVPVSLTVPRGVAVQNTPVTVSITIEPEPIPIPEEVNEPNTDWMDDLVGFDEIDTTEDPSVTGTDETETTNENTNEIANETTDETTDETQNE